MDAAALEQAVQALAAQNQQLQQQMRLLAAQQAGAAAASPPPGYGASSSPAPPRPAQGKLHESSRYGGTAALDPWLATMQQLCLFYGLSSDAQRVNYAAAHLKDAALQWWFSLGAATPATWADLTAALRARFQPVTSGELARAKLRTLTQGKGGVQAYVAAFNALLVHVPTMAVEDRVFAFIDGLSDRVKAHVGEVAHATLETAIERAVRFDSRQMRAPAGSSAGHSSHAPMDVNALLGIEGLEQETGTEQGTPAPAADAPVTRAEFQQLLNAMREQRRGPAAGGKEGKPRSFDPRDRRLPRIPHLTPLQVKEYMDEGKCFGCGSKDHRSRECQSKPQGK